MRNGTYKLHAEFERAINYLSDRDNLVALVTPEIGLGPGYIVLDSLPCPAPDRMVVNHNSIMLGSDSIRRLEQPSYDPYLAVSQLPTMPEILGRARTLTPLFPVGSPAFLFDDARETDFSTDFERVYLDHFKQGVANLTAGHHEEGTRLLKGLGMGLTPSGDDFLCGFLWALSLQAPHYDSVRNIVYQNAIGNNPIVNHFLQAAHQGLFFERFKTFANALCNGTMEDTRTAFVLLQGIGATSGADTAAGLLIGLQIQRGLNQHEEAPSTYV